VASDVTKPSCIDYRYDLNRRFHFESLNADPRWSNGDLCANCIRTSTSVIDLSFLAWRAGMLEVARAVPLASFAWVIAFESDQPTQLTRLGSRSGLGSRLLHDCRWALSNWTDGIHKVKGANYACETSYGPYDFYDARSKQGAERWGLEIRGISGVISVTIPQASALASDVSSHHVCRLYLDCTRAVID
jgi:hypothetical protein